jgi:hypothetical protein
MIMPIAAGIHIGDITHHQDHNTTAVNLSIKNTRNKAPMKMMPDAVELIFIIDWLLDVGY